MSNSTTFYNATESTVTVNFPTATNTTRPTIEITELHRKKTDFKSVLFRCNKPDQLVSQILSHDSLKQVALMNKQLCLIRVNANTDTWSLNNLTYL